MTTEPASVGIALSGEAEPAAAAAGAAPTPEPPPPSYAIVVPTIGRPCLADLLVRLGEELAEVPLGPRQVVVVDDRPANNQGPLPLGAVHPSLAGRLTTILSGSRGPAAARNGGWRAVNTDWVVFLDDDVLPGPGWAAALEDELAKAPADAGAVQARLVVPLPTDRPPSDWERDVAGLQGAPWITADLAYRRTVLATVGGFDERFPRAYREDVELALRVSTLGYRLMPGERHTFHPVRPAPWWVSVARQRGNADDAMLCRLHGRRWRQQAGIPPGRRRRHAVVAASGLSAGVLLAARVTRPLGTMLLGIWAAGTSELAWARIKPGPRTVREVLAMTVTSAALPFCAVAWYVIGAIRARRVGLPMSTVPSAFTDADRTIAA